MVGGMRGGLAKVGEKVESVGSRGAFLRMLRLASDGPRCSRGNASHDVHRQALLGVFVSAFMDELVHLVRGGLLRRYQSRAGDLRVVRGRLQVGRQAAAPGMRSEAHTSELPSLMRI